MKKNAIFFIFFLIPVFLFAENYTIIFQGKLTESTGTRVSGIFPVIFSMYSSEFGGQALWTETHNNINFENGIFTAELGSINSIGNLQLDRVYYIGINVNNSGELQPRTKINYNMFSIKSVYADTASAANYLNVNAVSLGSLTIIDTLTVNDLFVVKKDGKIGINTLTPSEQLEVSGKIKATYFMGDGSQLTNVQYNSLTGDAISGSEVRNLLNTIRNDSIATAITFTKIEGDTITKSEVNSRLLVVSSDTTLLNNRISYLESDSIYKQAKLVNYGLRILDLESDSTAKSYSVNNLTSNLTSLTNNKADSIHQHEISHISDSIPYVRLSGTPYIPDTSLYLLKTDTGIFALKNQIGIDTASADLRYLSLSADTMAADWLKVLNKPVNLSYFVNDSGFITSAGAGISQDSGDNRYIRKTDIISSDSVSGLTSSLTSLTNNKADSIHQHGISHISDSIPYVRLSGTPYIPDTSLYLLKTDTGVFALKNQIGIDTGSADLRYLSLSADTMTADWLKVLNKPINLSSFVNDSGFITSAGAGISQDSGDNRYIRKTDIISSDSVSGLTSSLTNLTNNKADSVHQHGISHISDSIPYVRLSGTPYIPDTSLYLLKTDTGVFALKNQIGIDTGSADLRYLSLSADTMTADWLKVLNKPINLSSFVNDSGFITSAGAGISQDSGDNRYRLRSDTIIADSIGYGNVNNTELNYLDGVTSSLQTQLNLKLSSVPDSYLKNFQEDTMPFRFNMKGLFFADTIYGNTMTISNTVYAASFFGNGSGLTGINASKFSGSAGDSIYITGTKLGIGVMSPTDSLHVKGSAGFYTQDNSGTMVFAPNGNLSIGRISSETAGAGIIGPILHVGDNGNGIIRTGQIIIQSTTSDMWSMIYGNYDFNLRRWNSSSWDQYFIIKSSGNVGIGTNSPSDSLQVKGSIKAETLTITKIIYSDTITANKFIGDGSGLTGITASASDSVWTISGNNISRDTGTVLI
nr:hypothetical protein [Candidatus Dependentiae bacterium]